MYYCQLFFMEPNNVVFSFIIDWVFLLLFKKLIYFILFFIAVQVHFSAFSPYPSPSSF